MIRTINKTLDISMLMAVTVGSLCPAYTIIYWTMNDEWWTKFQVPSPFSVWKSENGETVAID